MKKVVLLLLLSVFLFGCDSYLNKSVFEPLSREEVKKSVEKDSLFTSVYMYTQVIKEFKLKSELEQAEYSDLTYKRLYKFVKFMKDSAYFNSMNEKFGKEWENKYGIYSTKVDSVLNYWQKYKDENSLNQYVSIELTDIKKYYYSYIGGLKSVYLGFKLTPLKGDIEQFRFGFSIKSKIETNNKKPQSDMDYSWCLVDIPLTKQTTAVFEPNYSDRDIFESRNLEEFLRDYNLNIKITDIRKDGKNISDKDLGIPESVESYWKYKDTKYFDDIFNAGLIRETVFKDYLDKEEYQKEETQKILEKKDPLSYKFVKLGGEVAGNLQKISDSLDNLKNSLK